MEYVVLYVRNPFCFWGILLVNNIISLFRYKYRQTWLFVTGVLTISAGLTDVEGNQLVPLSLCLLEYANNSD